MDYAGAVLQRHVVGRVHLPGAVDGAPLIRSFGKDQDVLCGEASQASLRQVILEGVVEGMISEAGEGAALEGRLDVVVALESPLQEGLCQYQIGGVFILIAPGADQGRIPPPD